MKKFFDGRKKDPISKLERICKESGSVQKLQLLVAANPTILLDSPFIIAQDDSIVSEKKTLL